MLCLYIAAGQIKCLTVSPDGRWLAVGHSTGVVSTIDVRTGLLIASWKGHESDVLQVTEFVSFCNASFIAVTEDHEIIIIFLMQAKAWNSKSFITSSLDQSVCVWNADESKVVTPLRGHSSE